MIWIRIMNLTVRTCPTCFLKCPPPKSFGLPISGAARKTAVRGIAFGLPLGALTGWLFTFKTGNWPGLPHHFVLPWQVVGEGTVGALVFVLVLAVPAAVVLVSRAMRAGWGR